MGKADLKSQVAFHNSKAAEKLAAMASEERERAEETSDKLRETLVQVSKPPTNFLPIPERYFHITWKELMSWTIRKCDNGSLGIFAAF